MFNSIPLNENGDSVEHRYYAVVLRELDMKRSSHANLSRCTNYTFNTNIYIVYDIYIYYIIQIIIFGFGRFWIDRHLEIFHFFAGVEYLRVHLHVLLNIS